LYGPVEELSDEEITAQFATNVVGTLRMTRAVLPTMREQGGGRVIMVGSISSFALAPLSGMYSASKAALETASEALRYEVAHWGIEVGVVQPGVYLSGFHDSLARAKGLEGGESVYQPIIDRVVKVHFGVAASRPGPRTIALTIADAAEIEQPLPMRWPIGEDSRHLLMLRQSMTDEEWETFLRSGAAGIRSAYFEAAREVSES
jgi:NAD(P)-dependent dehydrogenase (short-subunit alcohol dehydrogenase family)